MLGTDYFPDLPPGADRLYLSVYTPWAATATTIDGAPVTLEPAKELGRRVYSSGIVVPQAGRRPSSSGSRGGFRTGGEYRLDLLRQATAAPDAVDASLQLTRGWRLEGGSASWQDRFSLDADRSISLRLVQGRP